MFSDVAAYYNWQGSQQHKVKFQDQVFTKFQDIFRSQEAQHIKTHTFSWTQIIHEHQ